MEFDLTLVSFIFSLFFMECRSIKLLSSNSTIAFENGSASTLLLDCPYQLSKGDQVGLVITWHFEDYPSPVYQWIPISKPQALGPLVGRVDLNYSASEEELHRHRALFLVELASDLTGVYTCRVSSFEDEKYLARKVVIYTAPREVSLRTDVEDEETVTISCFVKNIFPKPNIELNRIVHGHKSLVQDAKVDVTWVNGSYSATLFGTMKDEVLLNPTEFQCQVTIPDTDVDIQRTLTYKPRIKIAKNSGYELQGSLQLTLFCTASIFALHRFRT